MKLIHQGQLKWLLFQGNEHKIFNFKCCSSKCYLVTDDNDVKQAQKGIKRKYQKAEISQFLDALYANKIPRVEYNQLNFDKKHTTICLKSVQKPALNPLYTKMFVKDRVLCLPYD